MDTTLIVKGMTCSGCEKSVRDTIMQTPAVADVQIDRTKNQASITFRPDLTETSSQKAALEKIIAALQTAGFDCQRTERF